VLCGLGTAHQPMVIAPRVLMAFKPHDHRPLSRK
jgi:hypothetical protein